MGANKNRIDEKILMYHTYSTFFLCKLEQAVNRYFVHILKLVTDNNPSWMIQRKAGEW